MIDEVRYRILDFCAYSKEPLQLLLGSLVRQEVCLDKDKIVDVIIELVKKGFLEIYYADTGQDYDKVLQISKFDLVKHCDKYPSLDTMDMINNDYYCQTTDFGCEFLNDDDKPIKTPPTKE